MSLRTFRTEMPISITRPICGHDTKLVLELLQENALTMSELHEHGIQAPAQAVYELELAGYVIDRVPAHRNGSTTYGCRSRGDPQPSTAGHARHSTCAALSA